MYTRRQLEPYKYDELPSQDSFRVLELLPGQQGAEVSCRLHLANWNDPPHYEAISYAWGDVHDKVPIICQGFMLEVTPNLRDGLCRMRYTDRSRLLWADAACINQKNIPEQGQQVSHIRLIYERATRVVVWLGDDKDDQAAKAMQLVRAIASASCNAEDITFDQLKKSDHICNMTLHVKPARLPVAGDASWMALAWFFHLSWFSRLWVFQEVNCGRDVDMICGTYEIPWDSVALAANYIRARPQYSQREEFANGHYENACIMRRRYLHAQSSVLHILNSTKNFVTSDPLDRIYALMGTPPFMRLNPPLEVDYRKSKLQLYEELAVRCVCEDRDLGVLGYSLDTAEVDGFPSWIPDWEKRNWEYLIDHPHGEALSASGKSIFKGPTPVNSVLRASGFVFDVVTVKAQINIWDWFDKYGVALPRHTRPSSKQEEDEEMTPTIRRISTETFAKEPGYQSRETVEYVQRFLGGFAQYVARLLQLSKRDQAEIETPDETESPSKTASYQVEPRTKAWDRTSFVTKDGHMGFGPKSLVVGDLVCILFGGKVPFVLRAVDSHYLLVGPAYVEGIMEGEAIESRRADQLQPQVFEIH